MRPSEADIPRLHELLAAIGPQELAAKQVGAGAEAKGKGMRHARRAPLVCRSGVSLVPCTPCNGATPLPAAALAATASPAPRPASTCARPHVRAGGAALRPSPHGPAPPPRTCAQVALRCAAQHLVYSSVVGGLFGEDGRFDAFETTLEVRGAGPVVAGPPVDATRALHAWLGGYCGPTLRDPCCAPVQVLRVKAAHPDAPPEQYRQVRPSPLQPPAPASNG